MSFLPLFQRVVEFVSSVGVEPEFQKGELCDQTFIDTWSERYSIQLPKKLVDFYMEIGNGVSLRWFLADEEMGALIEIPRLEVLLGEFEEGKKCLPEFQESYPFQHADNPELAQRTAGRMRKWLPLISEGNGDSFCIDFNSGVNSIVFNQHDWYDGGSGNNGFVVGNDLFEFLSNWSSVCFQCPESLYWPDVFADYGVDWLSSEFDSRFRIKASA